MTTPASVAIDVAGLTERLGRLPTGVVWDVLRVMGLPHQALHHSVAPIDPGMRVCGPAFCVKGQAWLGSPPKPDRDRPQPRYALFEHLYPGCVMLVDSGGYDESVLMGENFVLSALREGCTGFVLDGATRDAAALVRRGTPVFKRFLTPVSSAGRWSITAFEVPIVMPGQTHAGVPVAPGDFVLADLDGVVIVPKAHAAQVVADSEQVQAIEEAQQPLLMEGTESRQAVYEKFDRFGHIRPVVAN